ncbi:MAG: histidine kinase [Actinomycetota bacterium]
MTAPARPLRWPWAVWGLTMCGLASAVTLSILNDSFEVFVVIAVLMMIGYGTIGAFIATRLPSNPIGWLMMIIGAGFALVGLTEEYLTYTVTTDPGALPGASVAGWMTNWIFVVTIVPIPLILSLFPTGRVVSPRWRWVVRAIVVGGALILLSGLLRPGSLESDSGVVVENPVGVEALRSVIVVTDVVGLALLLGGALASVASVVVRYRRSADEERRQIRGLAYLAAIALVLVIVAVAVSGYQWLGDAVFLAFFVAVGVGIPGAIGYAILRYRLYDIDLVVKKTVTYSLVAIALTGLYLAFVAIATLGNVSRLLFGVVLVALTARPVLNAARAIADRVVYGRRATPYEVLSEFSERMTETYSTDDVLPRMAQVLQGATGATRADVWLRVGRQLRASATAPTGGQPLSAVPAPDHSLPDLPGDLTTEVRHQGQLLGALSVAMPANDPLDPSRERLVHDLAAQAGPVLRNVRLIEELRASRQRLVAAQDEERRRLERNIHDGAQQQLVALGVKLRLTEALVERDHVKARELLDELQAETQGTIDDLRDLARGIYPPLLADQGLGVALEAQSRKSAVPVRIESDGIGRYGQDVEAAVYFSCLEALQNVSKYADASEARIALSQRDGTLEFTVSDDGRGFDPASIDRGTGLQGMSDRIEAIGGAFTVDSALGRGTTVRGHVPIG